MLRPPTIFTGGQRSLDEGIPSIDLIPPSPVLAHKSPVNILNASQLESNTAAPATTNCSLLPTALNGSGASNIHSVIIDDISKNSTPATSGPIYVPTISSTAAKLQLPSFNRGEPGVTSNSATSLSSTIHEPSEPLQRLPSLKRFRRTSSKRKKTEHVTPEDLEHQLNNGSDNSCLLTDCATSRSDVYLKPSSPNLAIRNKETNRLSPQNSIRRLSSSFSIGSGPGSRRASACLFNSQMYQNLNQTSKLHACPSRRRMSSIELAFTKTSHLNLHNLEPSRKSLSYTNSKMDLDKWQKSYTNETDMLQQYIQERDKRKNSICQFPKKRNEEEGREEHTKEQQHSSFLSSERFSKLKMLIDRLIPHDFTNERRTYSLYIFPEENRYRILCWM